MRRVLACAAIGLVASACPFGLVGAEARTLATTKLIVQVIGKGTITGGGGVISCGNGQVTCRAEYVAGGTKELTAAAAPGWTFSEWDTNCGTALTCNVTLPEGTLTEITATFSGQAGDSTVTVHISPPSGEDGGNVEANDADIDCGSDDGDCQAIFTAGSTITLYETPDSADFAFDGWGGRCDDGGNRQEWCTLRLDTSREVNASFIKSSTTAKLTVTVTGRGTVSGGGIACTASGGTCSATVTKGQSVTLEATPESGASFQNWGGACAGSNPTCPLTVNNDKSVTATFSGGGGATVPLTVSVSGAGSVTGAGINCGNGATTCTAGVPVGSTATLTATAASGSAFKSWGGDCAGSGSASTCKLTMNAAKTVTATFTGQNPPPGPKRTLTLKVAGAGSVSAPAGTCASTGPAKTCTQSYDNGSAISLTAVPAEGHTFVRWSGACTGSSATCSLTMNAAKSVTATFSGAPAAKPPGPKAPAAALRSLAKPDVERTGGGYTVTLRFSTTQRGTARVRAIRAGRLVTGLAFPVKPGTATVGPFPVTKPGFYRIDLALANHALHWPTCLGRCGKAAPAPPLVLEREPPRVVDGGAVWSVSLRFRTTLAIGARLRIYRGAKLLKDYRFAPGAGAVGAGPFVLSPGTYTIRLTAVDGFGRVGRLTWYALLP